MLEYMLEYIRYGGWGAKSAGPCYRGGGGVPLDFSLSGVDGETGLLPLL